MISNRRKTLTPDEDKISIDPIIFNELTALSKFSFSSKLISQNF